MPFGTRWQDQHDRIIRALGPVRRSRDEFRSDNPHGTVGYTDEVLVLFMHMWHLKDWIKNDPVVSGSARDDVEAWVAQNGHYLKIAADLANGAKHLAVQRPRAGGAQQAGNDVHIMVGEGVSHRFRVTDPRDGSEIEVIDLADRCLQEWQDFLDRHGLTRER